ncbi:MgtC/SapB family protein [Clostridium sp.]|uniref:MgtC/SapB family protein n=1 Tax=Clostridium sp. TaxID=1506 RepID=UPI0032164ABA
MDYRVIIGRLMIGVIVGGLVGYEREFKNSAAGFRTHILVCLGATIIAIISELNLERAMELATNPIYQDVIKVDMGRLGAQVISGVGFLGAGTILRDKGSIKGLTTAATLWVVACLGLAVGQGYYILSVTGAIMVFIILKFFTRADTAIKKEGKKRRRRRRELMEDTIVTCSDSEDTREEIFIEEENHTTTNL